MRAHPDAWLGLPIVARTGTCPVCGAALGTVQGLDIHNAHASIGERSYPIRDGVSVVHLFRWERAA